MQKNKKILVCAATTLLLFCTVGLGTSSFAVYQPYLISITGLTNSESSMFLTVRTMAGFVSTFLLQFYLDKIGLRRGVCLAAFCTGMAFAILGFAHSFPVACISAVLLGAGSGLGGTASASIILHRVFDEHMGLALSVSLAGTSFAMTICAPIVTYLVENFSLKMSTTIEALFVFICVAVILIPLGLVPDTGANGKKKQSASVKETFFHNTGLILCFVIMLFIGAIGNTGWSHLSVLYTAEGFTTAQVALLMSLVGAFLTFGKLFFGWCVDTLGGMLTFDAASVIMVVGLALASLAGLHSMPIAIVSMLLFGISLPMGTLSSGLLSKLFAGPGCYDTAVSKLQLAYMIGSLLYGPFPGIIADAFGGSYVPSFVLMTVFGVMTTVLMFVAFGLKSNKKA